MAGSLRALRQRETGRSEPGELHLDVGVRCSRQRRHSALAARSACARRPCHSDDRAGKWGRKQPRQGGPHSDDRAGKWRRRNGRAAAPLERPGWQMGAETAPAGPTRTTGWHAGGAGSASGWADGPAGWVAWLARVLDVGAYDRLMDDSAMLSLRGTSSEAEPSLMHRDHRAATYGDLIGPLVVSDGTSLRSAGLRCCAARGDRRDLPVGPVGCLPWPAATSPESRWSVSSRCCAISTTWRGMQPGSLRRRRTERRGWRLRTNPPYARGWIAAVEEIEAAGLLGAIRAGGCRPGRTAERIATGRTIAATGRGRPTVEADRQPSSCLAHRSRPWLPHGDARTRCVDRRRRSRTMRPSCCGSRRSATDQERLRQVGRRDRTRRSR